MIFFFTYRKKIIISFFLLFFFFLLPRQSFFFPGDYLFDVQRQRNALTDTNVIVHTSMQPYIYKEVPPDTLKKIKAWADPFFDKLLYENLIQLRYIDRSSKTPIKFNLDINPILNLNTGQDSFDTLRKNLQTNTRGVWVKGELGKKIIFESAFIENQSFLPMYLYAYSLTYSVVPGQGRWKTFKYEGFDYAMSSGIVHYQTSKNFSIRLGHGKQKVGYG